MNASEPNPTPHHHSWKACVWRRNHRHYGIEDVSLSDPPCTVRSMAERPTTSWRRGVAQEADKLAAGTLEPDCACMAELFPEELLVATDAVLDAFEAELPRWPRPRMCGSSLWWSASSWR